MMMSSCALVRGLMMMLSRGTTFTCQGVNVDVILRENLHLSGGCYPAGTAFTCQGVTVDVIPRDNPNPSISLYGSPLEVTPTFKILVCL